jgi:hypothetical protein
MASLDRRWQAVFALEPTRREADERVDLGA